MIHRPPREPHAYASLFPHMETVDFLALMEDIKENGQKEPILLFGGQILDGVNRYNACVKQGIEPLEVDFDGTEQDALNYVISKNWFRRHLTAGQRAQIAIRTYNMCRKDTLQCPSFAQQAFYEEQKRGEGAVLPGTMPSAKDREKQSNDNGLPKYVHRVDGEEKPKGGRGKKDPGSVRAGAAHTGVTKSSFHHAQYIEAHGIFELGQAVVDGWLTQKEAYRLAHKSEKAQAKLFAKGKAAVKEAAAPPQRASGGGGRKAKAAEEKPQAKVAVAEDGPRDDDLPWVDPNPSSVSNGEDPVKLAMRGVLPLKQRLEIASVFLDPYVGEYDQVVISDTEAFTIRLPELILQDQMHTAKQFPDEPRPVSADKPMPEEEVIHQGMLALASAKEPMLNEIARRMADEVWAAKHADFNVQKLRKMVEDRHRPAVALANGVGRHQAPPGGA